MTTKGSKTAAQTKPANPHRGRRARDAKPRIGLDGQGVYGRTDQVLRESLHSADYAVARGWLTEAGEARFLRIARAASASWKMGRPDLLDMGALRCAISILLTIPGATVEEAARRAAREAEQSGQRRAGPYASERGLRDALRQHLGRLRFDLVLNVAAEAVRRGDQLSHPALAGRPSGPETALLPTVRDTAVAHLCRALEGRVPDDLLVFSVEDAFDEMVAQLNRGPAPPRGPHVPTLAEPLPPRELQAVKDGTAAHLQAALDGLVDPSMPLGAVLDAFDTAVVRLNRPREPEVAEK